MYSKIHQINHYSKTPKEQYLHVYYLKFPGIKYYPNTGMLLTKAPITSLFKFSHGILLLRIISNPITCNHLVVIC